VGSSNQQFQKDVLLSIFLSTEAKIGKAIEAVATLDVTSVRKIYRSHNDPSEVRKSA